MCIKHDTIMITNQEELLFQVLSNLVFWCLRILKFIENDFNESYVFDEQYILNKQTGFGEQFCFIEQILFSMKA